MKNNDTNIGYKINRIVTTEFAFKELNNIDSLFSDNDRLKIDLNVHFNIHEEKNIIVFEIETNLLDTKNNIEIIKHKGKTEFEINNLKNTYLPEEDAYDLPDDLIIQLYSISYTHTRALLSNELSPTIYKNKYFLPIIDPRQIIKE